jgi:hypothetical protein
MYNSEVGASLSRSHSAVIHIQTLANIVIAISWAIDSNTPERDTYVHRYVSVIPALPQYWGTVGGLESVHGRTHEDNHETAKSLHQKITDALELTRMNIARNRRDVWNSDELRRCWQNAAASALKALRTYHVPANFPYSCSQKEDQKRLKARLFDVAIGKQISLETAELSSLLEPVDRRRRPRFHVDLVVTIWIGSRPIRAPLCDVSISGCRVAIDLRARRGDPVTVQILNGRRVEGEIVWSTAECTGIKFHTEFSPGAAVLPNVFEKPE